MPDVYDGIRSKRNLSKTRTALRKYDYRLLMNRTDEKYEPWLVVDERGWLVGDVVEPIEALGYLPKSDSSEVEFCPDWADCVNRRIEEGR